MIYKPHNFYTVSFIIELFIISIVNRSFVIFSNCWRCILYTGSPTIVYITPWLIIRRRRQYVRIECDGLRVLARYIHIPSVYKRMSLINYTIVINERIRYSTIYYYVYNRMYRQDNYYYLSGRKGGLDLKKINRERKRSNINTSPTRFIIYIIYDI